MLSHILEILQQPSEPGNYVFLQLPLILITLHTMLSELSGTDLTSDIEVVPRTEYVTVRELVRVAIINARERGVLVRTSSSFLVLQYK